MKPKSKILIIAGSDSSGGAGIQADIKTVTSLGGYAMTAITALTAQNTTGVKSVVPIDPKEIEKQILFTCKDINPDAIKIGMLHSQKVIISVIKSLRKIKTKDLEIGDDYFTARLTNYHLTFQNMLFKDDDKERMVMSKYDYINDKFLDHYFCDYSVENID